MHLASGLILEALPVVKDWAQHQLFSVHWFPIPHILTDVMVATTLSFTFDREMAFGYTDRARVLTYHRPELFRDGRLSVVKDMVLAFQAVERESITYGLQFIRYGYLSSYFKHNIDHSLSTKAHC